MLEFQTQKANTRLGVTATHDAIDLQILISKPRQTLHHTY